MTPNSTVTLEQRSRKQRTGLSKGTGSEFSAASASLAAAFAAAAAALSDSLRRLCFSSTSLLACTEQSSALSP